MSKMTGKTGNGDQDQQEPSDHNLQLIIDGAKVREK